MTSFVVVASASAFADAFDTSHSQVQRVHIDCHHPTYSDQPLIDVDLAYLVDQGQGQQGKEMKWIDVGIDVKRALVNSLKNGITRVVKRLGSSRRRGLLLLTNEYFPAYLK